MGKSRTQHEKTAKSRELDKKTAEAMWNALPEADRKFMSTMNAIVKDVGGKPPCYVESMPGLDEVLHEADRDFLFTLIAECLSLLLKSSILERVKNSRRQRTRRAACRQTKKSERGGRRS